MIDRIYIDSTRKILSEALARHIHQELGYDCFIAHEYLNPNLNNPENINGILHLIDAQEICKPYKWKEVKESISLNGSNFMALFDVPADITVDFEIEAFVLGFRGFFREDIDLDMFLKGIRSIFEGHAWFSRNLLDNFHIKDNTYNLKSQEKTITVLSPREKEILSYIAMGFRNKEIADRLCISTFTVRTHIYNLFRKINVPNRFQAALWAASHWINRNSIQKK